MAQLRRRGTLTALGAGVVITVPPLAVGLLEELLRDGGPGVLFELAFVAACVAGALHVRRSDLLAAPVSAPIAFTVMLLVHVFTGSRGGIGDRVLGLPQSLAVTAPWLFSGTILAGVVVGLRFLVQRRAERGRGGS
jgi:hypothetical protein